MTTRADYTSEEWSLLVEAPRIVGLGMLMVSRSGPIGKLREFLALRSCLSIKDSSDEMRQNQLIMAILAEQPARNRELTEPLSDSGSLVPFISSIIVSRLYMLGNSEMIADLLADRAPYSEAQEFKRWLMGIARRVAGASGDGWLGTGQKISEEEDGMLDQLATSLRTMTIIDAMSLPEIEALLGMRGQRSEDDNDSNDNDAARHGAAEGTENMLHRSANE